MPAPCRRVLAGPVTLRLRGVENALDAPADARRRFGLCLPDWAQDRENIGRLDLVDRFCAQRLGVNRQRHFPLRLVLLVAEAFRQLRGDLVRYLTKRRNAAVLAALDNRINPAAREPAARQCLLAGLGEPDFRIAPKPHFVRLARRHEA